MATSLKQFRQKWIQDRVESWRREIDHHRKLVETLRDEIGEASKHGLQDSFADEIRWHEQWIQEWYEHYDSWKRTVEKDWEMEMPEIDTATDE